MRVRTFWTIANQHTEKVFYGIYKPEDDAFRLTWEENEGWLDAGKAIDKEVDFAECKIVFWKDKPVLGFGTKVADPAKVKTDRPVTLTRVRKVTQPAEAEFTDPAHVGPVIFMTQMEMNNLIRSFVLMALGKVPEVGGAVSGLLGALWPEQKRDLIAESEARMKRWVQGRFQDYDRSFLANTLTGLRSNLEEYRAARGPGERARWFDNALAACERAMPFFVKNNYTPGTIDLAASVGSIHLTLLRERVLFGREILGDEEINEARFKETLKQAIQQYQTFISSVAIPGELKWRQEQIADEKAIGDTRYLTDWVTREVHCFSRSGRSQLKQGPSQVCVDYYREQAGNSLARQLHENVNHTARFWTLLDPDQANIRPIPLDGVTWVGPLAGLGYMSGNEHDFKHGDSAEDRTGRITEVEVWAGDRIDGVRFNSSGRTGRHYGTTGGTHRSVRVPDGAYLTRIETWFDFDLFGIRFHFSDGTSSDTFGHTWRGRVHQTAEFPHHHVTAVRVGSRMHEVRCGFTPLPDYYERLERQPA